MRIVVLVYTVYHSILTVNEILKYSEKRYKFYVMKKAKHKRLQLDFLVYDLTNAS